MEGHSLKLAGPTNPHRWIADHLLPMRHPTVRAMANITVNIDRGIPQRAADYAAAEIDIRIQLTLDEILIFQRQLFRSQCELEQRVIGLPQGA
jgi:hypothetical protein